MHQLNNLKTVVPDSMYNIDEYNNAKERKRLITDKYEDSQFEWSWNTSYNRKEYDKMRIQSVTYDKFAKFAVGGLILHRIISFIDIMYLERINMSSDLSFYLSRDIDSINLNLTKKL